MWNNSEKRMRIRNLIIKDYSNNFVCDPYRVTYFSEKVNLIHINLFLILPITICYFADMAAGVHAQVGNEWKLTKILYLC